jgi:macrocin-O-methyltransferase TylF-like protien
MKAFKTAIEQEVGARVEEIFLRCTDSISVKLENFPKYVRRQHLKRFLAMYEIFKLILPVKGSVLDCGVFRGYSLMAWAKLSAMLEPENLTRRIYGFDTFDGFPSISDRDVAGEGAAEEGDFQTNAYDELLELVDEFDRDRFLGHIPKVKLIRGDATETIPRFVEEQGQLLVSLLYIDFDLYEPTRAALQHFVPRMPKGAVLAFDELDNPIWPGETLAMLESLELNKLRLRRLAWDPYIGYAIIE